MQAGKLKFMRKFNLSPILTPATPAARLVRSAAFLVAMAAVPLATEVSTAQQQGTPSQFPIPDASSPSPRSGLNGHADDPMTEQAREKRAKELNVLRQKEMTSDAARLLALATDLKAHVDKGEENASSLELMHKAEQIEKLARSVRAHMTDAVGN
jgi:hypothetical protein